MVAAVLGLLLSEYTMNIQLRAMYVLPAVFAVVQCFLQTKVYIYESPKYLVQKGMMKEVCCVFNE